MWQKISREKKGSVWWDKMERTVKNIRKKYGWIGCRKQEAHHPFHCKNNK